MGDTIAQTDGSEVWVPAFRGDDGSQFDVRLSSENVGMSISKCSPLSVTI
jgi:hypothetical protein